MRARVVAVAVGIHVVIVGLFALAGRTNARPPSSVDVEVVAPIAVATESPPRPALPAIADRPRPTEPSAGRPRPRPTPSRIERLPPDVPVRTDTGSDERPTTDIDLAPVAGDGAGSGLGDGSGVGRGTGGLADLSAPPIPIDITASRTLPYTAEALRDRVSGDVQLVLSIDATGRVVETSFRHRIGYGLDEIATRIAMQLRFRAARNARDQPTTGQVRWRFHFEPP